MLDPPLHCEESSVAISDLRGVDCSHCTGHVNWSLEAPKDVYDEPSTRRQLYYLCVMGVFIMIWWIILLVVALLTVGFIRQVMILRRAVERISLATEFLNKFINWYELQDYVLYDWLLRKSETVQSMLGATGRVSLRRPFENGYHRNVPIILNSISEIQREWRSAGVLAKSLFGRTFSWWTIVFVDSSGLLRRIRVRNACEYSTHWSCSAAG